jgi:hypothetical protein
MSAPGHDGKAPPPEQQLMQMIMGKFVSRAITTAANLGIADHLLDGPKSASVLAELTHSHDDALYRLLRGLAGVGVFRELSDRRFENNALSEPLAKSRAGNMNGMARWINDPAGWLPWGLLDHSVKTGEPAAMKALGADDLFAWLGEHPASLAAFQDAMTSFSGMTGKAVADAYEFSGAKTIVDVGGGHGALLAAVIAKQPAVRGVLFDRPEVVAQAGKVLATSTGAIETVGGDFFESVPQGADVYMMKHIIHDWDDARSVKILSNCRSAMAPGGKVLIIDQVLTDAPEGAMAKLIDLEMLVMTHGGRERTEAEFARLFEHAGLKLARVVRTQSPVAVVEGVLA